MKNLPMVALILGVITLSIIPDIIMYNRDKQEIIEKSKTSNVVNTLGCKLADLDPTKVWVCPSSVKSSGIEQITCTKSGGKESCTAETYRVITVD